MLQNSCQAEGAQIGVSHGHDTFICHHPPDHHMKLDHHIVGTVNQHQHMLTRDMGKQGFVKLLLECLHHRISHLTSAFQDPIQKSDNGVLGTPFLYGLLLNISSLGTSNAGLLTHQTEGCGGLIQGVTFGVPYVCSVCMSITARTTVVCQVPIASSMVSTYLVST